MILRNDAKLYVRFWPKTSLSRTISVLGFAVVCCARLLKMRLHKRSRTNLEVLSWLFGAYVWLESVILVYFN